MENYEKVEKLRERANVSYEEAKAALENSGWDILDAMIYLEKSGKIHGPQQSSYSTQNEKVYTGTVDPDYSGENDHDFTDTLKKFGRWCLKIIKKGNTNFFRVTRHGKEFVTIPITVLVLLLIFAFWIVLPLLVVGLFFDMRYHFQGPDITATDLNHAMDGAAKTADHIKNEFTQNDANSNNNSSQQ